MIWWALAVAGVVCLALAGLLIVFHYGDIEDYFGD